MSDLLNLFASTKVCQGGTVSEGNWIEKGLPHYVALDRKP